MTWAIETVRDVALAPERVFRLYADPSTWSRWGHNAKWARASGPLVEGGTVDVRAGYGRTYSCRILRFVDGRALVLEAKPPFIKVVQTYELEPTASGARVRHALEISGPLSRLLKVARTDRVYQGWLDKEVERLIEMAGSTPA